MSLRREFEGGVDGGRRRNIITNRGGTTALKDSRSDYDLGGAGIWRK